MYHLSKQNIVGKQNWKGHHSGFLIRPLHFKRLKNIVKQNRAMNDHKLMSKLDCSYSTLDGYWVRKKPMRDRKEVVVTHIIFPLQL